MIDFFTRNLIWHEGSWPGIGTLFFLALSFFYTPLFILSIPWTFFLFYFFRFPRRHSHAGSDMIISPSDGRIVSITEYAEGPYKYRISIFLSPLDIHAMWTPITGKVASIDYRPGKFFPAFLAKSSLENEQNDLVLNTHGQKIIVRQIAGILARRIVCWVKKGDELQRGQAYGMIKFSSRIDLFLPDMVELAISHNQRVRGGETVIGRLIWQ